MPKHAKPTSDVVALSAALFAAVAVSGCRPVDAEPDQCAALASIAGDALGDGTLHDANTIEADETWTAAGSPHVVPNDFTVPAGVTLTLEPCAAVVVGLEREFTVEGTLDAVGTAEEPIVFTSTEQRQGAWSGITFNGAEAGGELAHVHIDSAGLFNEATILVTGELIAPIIRDSTLRDGQGDGILLEVTARFGPGSANNTITGMSGHPIHIEFQAVDGVLDGTYENNGDDRVFLDDVGISFAQEDITWHAISVPYLWDGDVGIDGVTVTIEPGTRIEIPIDDEEEDDGAIEIGQGGLLIAEGTADAPITFTLDADATAPAWYGVHVKEGGSASLDFVTLEGAGLAYSDAVGSACTNNAPENRSAIRLDEGGTLTLTNSTIRDVPGGFGVLRNYEGSGAPEFVDSNTFEGDMICGESDQYEIPQDVACDFDQCCAHAFTCNVDPT